jgi:D-alanyl-D-alanine dipeptidase
MTKARFLRPTLFLWVWMAILAPGARAADLPPGFVYVEEMIPGIRLEMRYAATHNFVGRPIDGYLRPKAILTREAAAAHLPINHQVLEVIAKPNFEAVLVHPGWFYWKKCHPPFLKGGRGDYISA